MQDSGVMAVEPYRPTKECDGHISDSEEARPALLFPRFHPSKFFKGTLDFVG